MEAKTKLGKNRTGMDMSPVDSGEMLQGSQRAVPTSEGDEGTAAAIRAEYIREADPIGSVPPPGTVKGMVKSGMQALTGNRPHVLIDKLGERLAFERGGTRLYEAIIAKCLATGDGEGVVDRARLEQIHTGRSTTLRAGALGDRIARRRPHGPDALRRSDRRSVARAHTGRHRPAHDRPAEPADSADRGARR